MVPNKRCTAPWIVRWRVKEFQTQIRSQTLRSLLLVARKSKSSTRRQVTSTDGDIEWSGSTFVSAAASIGSARPCRGLCHSPPSRAEVAEPMATSEPALRGQVVSEADRSGPAVAGDRRTPSACGGSGSSLTRSLDRPFAVRSISNDRAARAGSASPERWPRGSVSRSEHHRVLDAMVLRGAPHVLWPARVCSDAVVGFRPRLGSDGITKAVFPQRARSSPRTVPSHPSSLDDGGG